MTNEVKTTFTPQELGLIQDYAKGCLKERKVENISFFTIANLLKLPIFGSVFGSNQKDKADEKSGNYSPSFAITTVVASIFYFLSTIPKCYILAKEVHLTWQIKKLSKRKTSDYREGIIIENLKNLIKADKSTRHYTAQKIRMFAGFSFLFSTATWFLTYKCEIAKNARDCVNKVTPEFVFDFIRNKLPKSIIPSRETRDAAVEFLSNDKLVNCTKYITLGSFSLLAANKLYNLSKDFYHDTKHSMSFLARQSEVIQKTANELILEDERRKKNEIMQKMNQQQTDTVSVFNGFTGFKLIT